MAEGERGGPQGQARLRLPPTCPSPLARWVPPSPTVTWVGQPESPSQEKRASPAVGLEPGAAQDTSLVPPLPGPVSWCRVCVRLHLKDVSAVSCG